MTIAAVGVAEDVTRACFRNLRSWRDRWAAAHARLRFDVLSMGMSGDFALAMRRARRGFAWGRRCLGSGRPGKGKSDATEHGRWSDTGGARAAGAKKKTRFWGSIAKGKARLKIAVQAPAVEGGLTRR